MPIHAKEGGNWLEAIPYVFSNGAFVRVKAAFVRSSGAWEPLYSALEVSAAPAFLAGFEFGEGTKTVTTGQTATATADEGVGPFTYAWRRVSGSSAITANSASSANTAFSATMGPDESETAAFVCDVTDANGDLESTNTVTVDLSYTGVSK